MVLYSIGRGFESLYRLYCNNSQFADRVVVQSVACMLWEHEVGSSSLLYPTMNKILNNPHFYKDNRYDGTFEQLMD